MSVPTLFGIALWPPFDFGNAPPPTTTNAPNPDETLWTLGYGGAPWDGSVVAGFALQLTAQLLNDGMAVAFDPSATLDASAWRGGTEAALFAPTIAWDMVNDVVGGDPTRVVMTILASSTTALDQGDYHLQVGVTTSGTRSLCFDGIIRIGGTVGADSAAAMWCSLQDMLDVSSQLATMQARTADKAAFANIRARVTARVSRRVVRRYEGGYGYVKVRSLVADPILGTFDIPSATATRPSTTALTTALATPGGLILEEAIREIVARYSVAEVFARQVGSKAYDDEAAMQTAEADAMFRCWMAQVDLSSPLDGIPDALFGREVILLPPGTSP